MSEGPLKGIRILDFGRVLSAPYATLHLADLGADVVKVEHPNGGDDTRSFGPPFVGGLSTYFLSVNRGKRSIVLDLKTEEGRSKARALALKSDVVIENFRPDVMAKLGLGYEELCLENPSLIYASLSGFGHQRPDKPGYDLMIQGLSGIPSITGPVDGEPYKCGAAIADLVAGMNLVQGVLAALFRRERTGRGGFVDVSMIDGMRSLLTYHAGAYLNAGFLPQKMGNGHPSIHPFRSYLTADGLLNICVGNDRIFSRLAKALGHPQWAQDERFKSNPQRVANRNELNDLLEPLFLQKNRADWEDIMSRHGVPVARMATIPEALDGVECVEHSYSKDEVKIKSLPLPFGIDKEPRGAKKRAPLLGEHTEEVCSEWLKED